MWIKKQEGLTSIELIISAGFLIVLVFFSWQMLERQKSTVIKANQDVEATGVVFEIRQALRGRACRENFSGLNISTNSEVIKNIKVLSYDDEIQMIYNSGEKLKESKTGLSVSSYELKPVDLNHRKRDGLTYLKIHFDRGDNLGRTTREIKIFVKEIDYKIIDCSLNPFLDMNIFWQDQGNFLSSTVEHFQINSEERIGTLNIQGGLFVEPSVVNCSNDQWGSIFWSESERQWLSCRRHGVESFSDQRIFIESNLTEMVENNEE